MDSESITRSPQYEKGFEINKILTVKYPAIAYYIFYKEI